ncbi:exopolysaccharide biosynthesis polyprenyl glycosylphosphotransferase [uncultured Croceicoccus sp.]|uniref:exopolysaccharide biosynthesis polyprenyl glycosylphosphotransferase n=1 Tax=uncultured Croceicoccus sp. TaxID=1295329 RepID=UPI002627D485|nr:exopolysaccharide biosynthesis polyprenyl glycosylphosphotransferase [uncultured Croceicoccus sp.]
MERIKPMLLNSRIATDARPTKKGKRQTSISARQDRRILTPSQLARIPSLEHGRLQCYLMLVIGDLAALAFGFFLASYIYLGAMFAPQSMMQIQMILPVFLTIGLYNGSYSIKALRQPTFSILRAIVALLVAAAIITFVAFFAKSSAEFSRSTMALSLLFSVITIIFVRDQMRSVIRQRCGTTGENFLIVSDGGPKIESDNAYYFDAERFGLRPDIGNPEAIERLGKMLRHMDRVLVSCAPERRGEWAHALKCLSVDGEILDDSVRELGALGAHVRDGMGILLISHRPLGLRARIMKRAFDLAVAGPAVILLSPLLGLIALAIWLEDRGPVFFLQKRMGRSNQLFSIYKFRSMRSDRLDSAGNRSASKDDDRITKVGRFLRRTSLDEVPQLLNVLGGSMSIVGPRPHALGSQAGDKLFWEIDSRYWQRHTLKPGLTGLAQVRGFRGATDTEGDLTNRLQSDLQYMDGWSLWRDISISFATARVLVHDRAF